MSDTGEDREAVQLEARAVIQGEARRDGYRPISDAMWVWGTILGFPPLEETRLLLSAARRLDSGHLQIERVRESIVTAPPEGSIAAREAMHEVIGDAELAVMSLDKALDVIASLSGRYRLKLSMPGILVTNRKLIANLRDHYAHIDERALGKIHEEPNPEAENAWLFAELLVEHKLTDGHGALGIDDEMTELCISARGYLLTAWTNLVARARST